MFTVDSILEFYYLYKEGKSKFKDYGLGQMTEFERNSLLQDGKIVEQDGVDVIAISPGTVVEYKTKNGEYNFFQTFLGDKSEFLAECFCGEVKNRNGQIIKVTNTQIPKWDNTTNGLGFNSND